MQRGELSALRERKVEEVKPIKFKESNAIIGKDQPEYKPLPAFVHGGEVITCWRLSMYERLKALVTGKVWLSVLTHGQNLQPLFMCVTPLIEENREPAPDS